jgi:hypothetical protein
MTNLLYARLGALAGTPESAALSLRLTAWHDAMVAHERLLRARREDACHDECPHAEAEALWTEARAAFGRDADDLTFLRSRAVQWRGRETTSAS